MPHTSFTVIGLSELKAKLVKLAAETPGAIKIAGDSAAMPLENRWKEKAPVKSGTYRRSIQHEVVVSGPESAHIIVGTDITEPPYPVYLEYGTSRMPPHPSMTPAYDETKDEVVAEFAEAFSIVIQRIAR